MTPQEPGFAGIVSPEMSPDDQTTFSTPRKSIRTCGGFPVSLSLSSSRAFTSRIMVFGQKCIGQMKAI